MSLAVLAHAIHYAIILGGLIGVVALLLPHRLGPAAPCNDLERRIAALREEVGAPGTTRVLAPVRTAEPENRVSHMLLPLAAISSVAAAGVHAAMGPAHLREGLLIGSFFVISSTGQLAWAALLVRGCSRRLLELGALGNVFCIGLWVQTRTTGLPFGLTDGPEAVGAWDLAAVTWEAVVIALVLLRLRERRAEPSVLGDWSTWDPLARTWLLVSAITLLLLSVTGT